MLPRLSSLFYPFFSSLASFLAVQCHMETSSILKFILELSIVQSVIESSLVEHAMLPGYLASVVLAASCGVELSVSNDLLSVRAPTLVTQCSLRFLTRAGKPRGGDPIYTTACYAGPEFPRAASTSIKA